MGSPADVLSPPENETGKPPAAATALAVTTVPLTRWGPMRTTGLTMTLNGIVTIKNETEWMGATKEFFRGVYDDDGLGGMYHITVELTMTGMVAIGGSAGSNGESVTLEIFKRNLRGNNDVGPLKSFPMVSWLTRVGQKIDP